MAKKRSSSNSSKSLYDRFIEHFDSLNMLQYVRTEAYAAHGKKLYARSAAVRPYDMLKYDYSIENESFKSVAEDAKKTAFISTPHDETGAKRICDLAEMFMQSVVKYMSDVDEIDMHPELLKLKSESVAELDLKMTLAGF